VANITTEELEQLRNFVPLDTLTDEQFNKLTTNLVVETAARGDFIFREGDTAQGNYYLLDGVASLLSGKRTVERISTGDEKARFPIANQLPRSYSVKASVNVRYVRIDGRKLGALLATDAKSEVVVEDVLDDDWMSLLLQTRVMQHIPPSNIQRVLSIVEHVDVQAGMMIIHQGDEGDYYYMLVEGAASVTQAIEGESEPIEVAKLTGGDAFGEEALLSDYLRNSSVSMETDGSLIRLKKENFLELIHQPLLKSLSFEKAKEQVDSGSVYLDVRTAAQYEESHFPGSVNIPSNLLRRQISSLANDRQYIICSHTGLTAISSAFLLSERGFDVSVLAGGYGELTPIETTALTKEENIEVKIDDKLYARIQSAENKAKELASQLEKVKKQKQKNELERRKNLANLKESVDRAKQRMIAFEKETHAALEAKNVASAELKKMEDERQILINRIEDIDGIEEKLSLVLVERENERDAAKEENVILQTQLSDALTDCKEVEFELLGLREHIGTNDPAIVFLEEQNAKLEQKLSEAKLAIGENSKVDIELIKTQSEETISLLREKLADTEKQLNSTEAKDDPLEREALRQDFSNLQITLDERDRDLVQLNTERQQVEDELEDAHREIDALRRNLDDTVVSAEESDYMRKEAEDARKHVEDTLYQIQEDVEEKKTEDFRDDRFASTKATLNVDHVLGATNIPNVITGIVSGVALTLVVIELVLWFFDKEELFSMILGSSLS